MASASLGRLTLDLVAKISGYTEPLNRAERETRRSTKSIVESFDLASLAVKGFGVVLGGLSVAGVVAYSEQVINAGNDVQRFAKLANASVEQFQYYAKGASTAGFSVESFADKLKDMQDRIGDFQQTGGGPLADFFTNIAPRVGVTIQQFQKLSGPDALQLFYNSLEKAGASTNDMKFYMEAIISDSSLLIPLLENGGAGFKKWGDAAQKAGAIMSQDMIQSLADAKENLQLLDLQWQGLQANLINNIIPVIETISENWDKIEAGAIALSAVIGTRLALAFGVAGFQAAASLIEYGKYQVALARMAGETITLTTVTRGLGGAMLGLVGGPVGLIALGVQVAIAGGTYYAMTRNTKDATDALEDQALTVSELGEKYKKLTASQLALRAIEATDEIEAQTEKLRSYKSAIQQVVDELNAEGDVQQSGVLKKYLDDLKAGGELAKNAFAELQKQGLVSEANLKLIADLDSKIGSANIAIDKQKSIQDLVKKSTEASTQAQKEQKNAVDASTASWLKLTDQQRKYITQINQDVMRENYTKALVEKGFTPDKANFFADAQAANNGENAFKVGLPQAVLDATVKSFNLKNYSFNKAEFAAIAKVKGIAKANNFAQIEGLYGLPVGTLAALVLQESGGNANAVSPTGAKGLFQTTGIYRKGKDLSTIEKQATEAAKYLKEGYEQFGNWMDAITTYNSGVEGLKDYKKGGRSPEKRKEIAGYAPGVQRWLAGVNDKTAVDNSILMPTQADILAQQTMLAQSQKELDDTRKEIDAQYYTESEKLAKDHQDRIEKITQAYTGTKELKTRLTQEDALYKEQLVQLDVGRKNELNQLAAFETDRITQTRQYYDEEIRLMQVSTKYFGADRAMRLKLLEGAKRAEIDAIKREENEQVQSAFELYLNETEIVVKRYQREREEIIKNYQLTKDTRDKLLQANQMNSFYAMNQASDNVFQSGQNASLDLFQKNDSQGFDRWSLQNQYSTDLGGLNTAYNSQVMGIDLVADETERNAQLLAAHEQYLQAKAALDAKYADDEEKLRAAQLSMNLSYGEQIFGSMTDMLEASGDKQSGVYKAMFAANKAFAIAQSLVSIQQGIAQAAANPFPLNLAAMASVAAATAGIVSNISSVAGVFHGGTDYVPKEASYLLDKGERVLSPRQNGDLTRYLNQRQNTSSGDVVINNNGSNKVTATRGADGKTYVTIDEVENYMIQSLNNPNSKTSKAMQQNYNAQRRR